MRNGQPGTFQRRTWKWPTAVASLAVAEIADAAHWRWLAAFPSVLGFAVAQCRAFCQSRQIQFTILWSDCRVANPSSRTPINTPC
jgi:hypothetical protein